MQGVYCTFGRLANRVRKLQVSAYGDGHILFYKSKYSYSGDHSFRHQRSTKFLQGDIIARGMDCKCGIRVLMVGFQQQFSPQRIYCISTALHSIP